MNNNLCYADPISTQEPLHRTATMHVFGFTLRFIFWRNILAAAHAAPSTVPRSNHLFDSYADDTRFSQQATCRKASFQQ